MKIPSPLLVLLAVPLLALSGCLKDAVDVSQLGLGNDGGIFGPGGLLGGEPEYVFAEAGELPPELPAMMSALMLRLRGASADQVARLLSVSGSEAVEPETTFRYRGFVVRRVLIEDFEADEDRPGNRRLAGRLYLEDPMGRATSLTFELSYGLRDQRLQISQASWMPALSKTPRTAMFVVPKQAIEPDLEGAGESYRKLYALVLDRALPMNATAAVPEGAQDYLLFVFFEDRLAPEAELELRIGTSPDAPGGYAGASSLLVYPEGWAIGVVAGRFALSGKDPYWVKAYYKPEAGDRLDLVGLFSTAPGAEPAS